MNVPNFLAFVRLVLAVLLFAMLSHSNYFMNELTIMHISWFNYFVALIFTIGSITDFFDGYIARAWNQKTRLGEVIDPLADKMLTLAAFLGLMMMDRIEPMFIYLILVREFFITGFRVIVVSSGFDIAAKFSGKLKTVFQMLAIGFLMMDWPGGKILFYICFILTIYSGVEYVLDYSKATKKECL